MTLLCVLDAAERSLINTISTRRVGSRLIEEDSKLLG